MNPPALDCRPAARLDAYSAVGLPAVPPDTTPDHAAPVPLSRRTHAPWAARTLQRMLQALQFGTLEVTWPNGQTQRYGRTQPEATDLQTSPALPTVHLHVHDWSACRAVLQAGDIGFGESYLDGLWHSDDLAGLMRLVLRNRAVLERAILGSPMARLLYRFKHWCNRNTRRNSRRNIAAHYDLGNSFYRLWLDASMNYSSAWFEGQHDADLTQAQYAKVARALRQARVQPGARLLEIGCGWGALAEQAQRDSGAHVTGVTLSSEQLAYARQRPGAAGADLRLQDYRDLCDPPFDAICSIEMFEAVGKAYWPVYFGTVQRLLKPGGRACIQSIVIRDELFAHYQRSTDFIQQYIFPGGCLPSRAEFVLAAQAAGLRLVDELPFGPDYAETLRRWRSAFVQQRAALHGLGFDARFERLWTFYLAYCEAGFDSGDLNVYQFTLERPQ